MLHHLDLEQIRHFQPRIIFDEMNLAETDYKFEESDVPWVYMDVPRHVRQHFDLMAVRLPGVPLIPTVDEPREKYWLSVVEQMSVACKVSKVMVICGLAHLESFGQKLRANGHQVTGLNMREQNWYDDRWIFSPDPIGQ
jgi:hypothetical protein